MNKLFPWLLLSAVFFIFYSCSNPVEDKLDDISGNADKVEIFFYNGKENNIDDRSKIIILNERDQIKYLFSFISEDDSPEYKCGYNGSIKFYNNNAGIFDTEFNIEIECSHFSFVLNDELYFKKMKGEGRSYLEDLFLSPDNKNLILNDK
jgi:hypothetical protein